MSELQAREEPATSATTAYGKNNSSYPEAPIPPRRTTAAAALSIYLSFSFPALPLFLILFRSNDSNFSPVSRLLSSGGTRALDAHFSLRLVSARIELFSLPLSTTVSPRALILFAKPRVLLASIYIYTCLILKAQKGRAA